MPVWAGRKTRHVGCSQAPQPYFTRVECAIPTLYGLDPYEMIGEKIMACNRRVGGSAKPRD
jgi:hypothetical protein